jgi:hypothetical protein
MDQGSVSATKRGRPLAEKDGTHRPGKRQHAAPLAEKARPLGKSQCVTHQEDSEPVLADTNSESSDDGFSVPEKLCNDLERDKSSEVSKEYRWISCRKNTGYHATDPKIRMQGAEHGRSWIATKHDDESLESSNA